MMIRSKLRRISFLWVVLLTILPVGFSTGLTGCAAPPAQEEEIDESYKSGLGSATSIGETSTSGTIYIAADETLKPIVESMVNTFMGNYEKAKITPLYMPGEVAIQSMLSTDSIRLVVTGRTLTRSEEATLIKQRTSAKTMTLGTDAIAFILNKDNTDTKFTQDQLRDILTGKITTWKEINPESPLGEISVVFDNGSSSTVQYLQANLLQGAAIAPAKAYSAKTNPQVLDYIGENQGAIGIIGIAWISDSDDQAAIGFKENIKIAKVENPAPCAYTETYGNYHQPYQGMIKTECYPFTRKIYSLSRETRFGLGTGFVSFMMDKNTGQRIVLKAGLVPERAVPRIVKFPPKKQK